MQIELKRIDENFLMEASNEMGNTVKTDGSPDIGGANQAMRPMQLMLVGIGSCSSIDVIHILRKQRQPLEDIHITVTAEREEGKVPSLFTAIHLHYKLEGDLNPSKVEQAITLSVEKYCSVAKLLEKTAKITWTYEINEQKQ